MGDLSRSAPSLRRVTLLLLMQMLLPTAAPFVVAPPASVTTRTRPYGAIRGPRLWAAADDASVSTLPDISGMSAGDLRRELESYGLSTKSFLEKKDLIQALEKARAEGLKPKETKSSEPPTSKAEDSTAGGSSDGSAGAGDAKSRAERIQEEMAKANAMKVGDLKKELQALGVSTASFFEKSEFVRAYAEAVVDGVSKAASGAGAGAKAGAGTTQDEPFDPTYRDVAVQKFNGRDPRLLSGVVIDIPLRR